MDSIFVRTLITHFFTEEEIPSDLVIEFRENTHDKLLISRDIEYGERVPSPNPFIGRFDISVGMFLGNVTEANSVKRPAVLHFRRVPNFLSDGIWGWMKEQAKKPEAKVEFLRKVYVLPCYTSDI